MKNIGIEFKEKAVWYHDLTVYNMRKHIIIKCCLLFVFLPLQPTVVVFSIAR